MLPHYLNGQSWGIVPESVFEKAAINSGTTAVTGLLFEVRTESRYGLVFQTALSRGLGCIIDDEIRGNVVARCQLD
jgi:hypothetical protein